MASNPRKSLLYFFLGPKGAGVINDKSVSGSSGPPSIQVATSQGDENYHTLHLHHGF